MHVLAVDTTTPRGSVAVVSEGGVLGEARVATAEGHSRWLLLAADALLRGLGLEASAIDAFAVTTGPGSFTGLRIGLASVQGLALACGRPCVGLSALDVLALAAAGRGGAIVALMDAFRGEVYAGVYDGGGAPLLPASVGTLEAILPGAPSGASFVGDAAVSQRARIAALRPDASFPDVDLFLAAPLGRAGLAHARAGSAVAASRLRPLYLRGAGVRVPRP
ncbi:MAG: tRNA (adenosine(37)-N6)-threonylcarbamoyltransferase complex dimerization subunit type 1 TsaB [Betaproteobacteria bacterium]